MKINWKVRMNNRMFWIGFIPMFFLLLQQVLQIFGVQLDVQDVSDQLVSVVETVFCLLAMLGVVTDPTTRGVGDSNQAMTYDTPKE